MAKKFVANPDSKTLYTPRGELGWPKLTEPDFGSDDYPTPQGVYKTDLILVRTAPGVEKFLAILDKMMDRAKEIAEEKFAEMPVKNRKALEAKGGITANPPYIEEYDEDTEEPTGRIILKVKRDASGVRKKDNKPWTAKVDLFDAKGVPFKKGKSIWGGSTAILNIECYPYFVAGTGAYGVSKRLNAAQIIALVSEGGSRSASSYGFQVQEGYDSSEDDEVSEDTSNDDDVSGDDGDDSDIPL